MKRMRSEKTEYRACTGSCSACPHPPTGAAHGAGSRANSAYVVGFKSAMSGLANPRQAACRQIRGVGTGRRSAPSSRKKIENLVDRLPRGRTPRPDSILVDGNTIGRKALASRPAQHEAVWGIRPLVGPSTINRAPATMPRRTAPLSSCRAQSEPAVSTIIDPARIAEVTACL